jgi:hypothetical protein
MNELPIHFKIAMPQITYFKDFSGFQWITPLINVEAGYIDCYIPSSRRHWNLVDKDLRKKFNEIYD